MAQILRRAGAGAGDGQRARLVLAGVTALIPLGLGFGAPQSLTMLGGLGLFGVASRSIPRCTRLAYSEAERVSLSVGLNYMANATGRLMGTLLSGVLYQMAGVTASLWGAVVLPAIADIVAMFLPPVVATEVSWAAAKGDD